MLFTLYCTLRYDTSRVGVGLDWIGLDWIPDPHTVETFEVQRLTNVGPWGAPSGRGRALTKQLARLAAKVARDGGLFGVH